MNSVKASKNPSDVWQTALADIIFSAVFRTYSTISGRRFVCDLRDALAKGYLSKMPSYNSIFDYLKMESLTPYLKELITLSSLP
jgi:trans-aconitate methyltransferase